MAAVAAGVVGLLAFGAVTSGVVDSARAIGLPVPALWTPFIAQSSSTGSDAPAGVPLVDPVTGRLVYPSADGSGISVTTTEDGQVVVTGLGSPAGRDATTAFIPWIPDIDADGKLPSSTPGAGDTPDPSPTPDIPYVPVVWTPEPSPFPTPPDATTDPTTDPSTDPVTDPATDPVPADPTPTFEPSTPGPGLPPPSSDPATPPADPTTPPADPTTPAPPPTTSTPPAPTTPPPTTPAPPPPTTSAAALRWSPPALTNPIVMAYPEGSVSVVLDTARDYILTLPRNRALVNTHGLTISGGRNVVIIGGTVDVRDGVSGARRGMYLANATPNGITYIEGVRFQSSTAGSLTEGIDIGSPGARVILQNIAIDGTLSGTQTTNHADAIQAWAGPEVLQIDGFSARTSYQGFFLLPTQHSSAAVSDWSLNRISLTGTPSGYLLWRDGGPYSIRTTDVYVNGSSISNGGLWPNAGAWPNVTQGRAPTTYGASAGFTYTTPGYR